MVRSWLLVLVVVPACGSGTGRAATIPYDGPLVTGQEKLPNTFPVGSSAGTAPVAAPAPGPSPTPNFATLLVQNNGNLAVFFFYMSLSTDPFWGPDQLGTEVILPGEAFLLTDIDPGIYDTMVEYSDGTQVIVWQATAEAGIDYIWNVTNQ